MTARSARPVLTSTDPLPISWVDPVDIGNAIVGLASGEARYVTGVALPVDGGITAPFKIPHNTG